MASRADLIGEIDLSLSARSEGAGGYGLPFCFSYSQEWEPFWNPCSGVYHLGGVSGLERNLLVLHHRFSYRERTPWMDWDTGGVRS